MRLAPCGHSYLLKCGLITMRDLSELPSVKISNLLVHELTMSETLDALEGLIEMPGVSQHVVVNAAKVVAARNDAELRGVIADGDIINADGMSIVWASRLLGTPLPERVTGIDVMFELLHRAEDRGWGVFLLGARDEVITTVKDRIRAAHPSLNVAGHRHGYWTPEDEATVVSQVRASGADILFVALPSPAKELFVGRHRDALGVRLVVGVGGSFDIIAGETERAPEWMQSAGLEWAYRFSQEPRRMWRRYLIGNAKYIYLISRQWLAAKRRR